jgi:outer membrane protein, heavy metal efflux system
MKRLISSFLAISFMALQAQAAEKSWDLPQILSEVVQVHPGIAACQQELALLENQIQAAGLLENPRLEAMGEDFLGSAATSSQNYMQFTLSASQNLPVSGRLGLQQEAFKQQYKRQAAQCQWRQRQLKQEIGQAYLAVLNWQAALAQSARMQSLSQDLLKQTDQLIAVGKITALERTLPATELARIQIEHRHLDLQRKQSLQTLFSYWNAKADPEWILAELPVVLSEQTAIEKLIATHPQYQEQSQALAQIRLEIQLAKAQRLPDLNLGSALRWHPQSQELGLNLFVSAPMPVFNNQSYAISMAEIHLKQAEYEQTALKTHLKRELEQLLARIEQGRLREESYRKQLLPLAQAHLQKLKLGLEAGKFKLLHVLQAQEQILQLEQEALKAEQELAREELSLAFWLGAF